MIEIGNKKIYIGDFHTHWYWDKENPTLFIAGMYSLGYDFVLLCDGYNESRKIDDLCKTYEIPFRVFAGKEIANEDAHIVVWIDKNFETYTEKIPIKKPYNFLRETTKLIISAHPGKNWSDSFDGTYRPLFNLYKEKLIDAIQLQEYTPYKIFEENNTKISVVGGLDIHCCQPFIRYPVFLFNKNFTTFKHIIPCSRYATVIISEGLEEESIINSIKNCLAVSYNLETDEFIGDRAIIKFLIENRFIEKFKYEQKKRGEINIKGDIFTGEKGEISFKGVKNIRYFIIPDGSLYKAKRIKKVKQKNKINVFQILNRENFYIPLTIKGERTYFYGLLVKTPVETKINSIVKKAENGYIPYVEILLKNRTGRVKKIKLKVDYGKGKEGCIFVLNKSKRVLIPVDIDNFGIEYDIRVGFNGKTFNINYDLKMAFPVCKYNKTPWQIDRETSIKIIKNNIYNIENWRGRDDLSGEINLYWDERHFYLYAEITDDIFYQRWTDWETFWGDSIQFAFGPDLRKIDAYGFNYELIIAKTEKGNEIFVWNKYGKIEQTRKLYRKGILDIVRDEVNKKIIYMLKMPWKFFREFKPEKNRRFLFSLVVFDNDGTIEGRKWFYFGENIGVRKSMRNAHTITLIK